MKHLTVTLGKSEWVKMPFLQIKWLKLVFRLFGLLDFQLFLFFCNFEAAAGMIFIRNKGVRKELQKVQE